MAVISKLWLAADNLCMRLATLLLILLLLGCAPPVKPPDPVEIKRGMARSEAVQSETDKRVKEYEALAK
jgi:hypothetical protein